MEHSIKYTYFMSQLTHIKDIKESDKVKISVVYHERLDAPCILRICKNRDLSSVYSTLRRIRNPNTVVVHDFVYDNGDTYILEELVDGRTISEILTQTGILSEETTAKIIIKVCNALEMLHCQKPPIVHNDINPSNIKIREDGSVKLFDFDISRTYKKGQQQNTVLFGTEEYAAPEHFGYGQSEPRTDIYSLGVTMHKMLTGRSLSNDHRITYSGKLKAIVRKCLAIDPQHRYSSVVELKKDLEIYLQKKNRLIKNIVKCACFSVIIAVSFLAFGKLSAAIIEFQTNLDRETTSNLSNNSLVANNMPEYDNDSTSTVTEIQESIAQIQKNHTLETASIIAINQKNAASIDADISNWYRFTTSYDLSTYRINLDAVDPPTHMSFPYIYIALFDS